jgi:hypothetical protein
MEPGGRFSTWGKSLGLMGSLGLGKQASDGAWNLVENSGRRESLALGKQASDGAWNLVVGSAPLLNG